MSPGVEHAGPDNEAIRELKDIMKEGGQKQNDRGRKIKWWKNPYIMVPASALILAALISAPWWPNILLKKENLFNEQESNKEKTNIDSKELVSFNNLLVSEVRPLEPLETGKTISNLPNGTYFFATPSEIVYEVGDPKNDFVEASNKYSKNFQFEIQKINNRYFIVGFVSDETYAELPSVSSKNSLMAIFYPNSWGGANKVVKVPFDSIYSIDDREINLDEKTDVYILDIGFKEAYEAISHRYN